MTALTPQQQIEILENIDWKDLMYYKDGLCFGIMISFRDTLNMRIDSSKIEELIPLFTIENALKFEADSSKAYWWDFSIDGYHYRKCFIDWIIETLKKQISNELNS